MIPKDNIGYDNLVFKVYQIISAISAFQTQLLYQEKYEVNDIEKKLRPLYILHINSGSDCEFAFLLLKNLSLFLTLPFQIVFLDSDLSKIDSLRVSKQLYPYVKSGCLDFAYHKWERYPSSSQIKLLHSNQILSCDKELMVVCIHEYFHHLLHEIYFKKEDQTIDLIYQMKQTDDSICMHYLKKQNIKMNKQNPDELKRFIYSYLNATLSPVESIIIPMESLKILHTIIHVMKETTCMILSYHTSDNTIKRIKEEAKNVLSRDMDHYSCLKKIPLNNHIIKQLIKHNEGMVLEQKPFHEELNTIDVKYSESLDIFLFMKNSSPTYLPGVISSNIFHSSFHVHDMNILIKQYKQNFNKIVENHSTKNYEIKMKKTRNPFINNSIYIKKKNDLLLWKVMMRLGCRDARSCFHLTLQKSKEILGLNLSMQEEIEIEINHLLSNLWCDESTWSIYNELKVIRSCIQYKRYINETPFNPKAFQEWMGYSSYQNAFTSFSLKAFHQLQDDFPKCLPFSLPNLSTTNPSTIQNIILEEHVVLSKSLIWRLSQDFYNQMGACAWTEEGNIPSFITTNSFIANYYAQYIVKRMNEIYLSCCSQQRMDQIFTSTNPLYILDLGAGTGKFGYLFIIEMLNHLNQLKKQCKQSCPACYHFTEQSFHTCKLSYHFCYILSDFTSSNVSTWQQHPQFQSLVDKKILDFAVFNADIDSSITLLHSGKSFAKHEMDHLIVIANYFFDSLNCDVFRVEKGILKHGLVKCSVDVDKKELEEDGISEKALAEQLKQDPSCLQDLKISFEYQTISTAHYYENEILNQILDQYVQLFQHEDQTIFLPIGSLRCIWNLFHLCQLSLNTQRTSTFHVLSSDKGVTNINEIQKIIQHQPYIDRHGGSMSVVTNFHAIDLFFQAMGGYSTFNANTSSHLKTCLFTIDHHHSSIFHHPFLLSFGPDDFFHVSHESNLSSFHLNEIFSFLRLSHFDPDIFYKYRNYIRKQILSIVQDKQWIIIWSNVLQQICYRYFYIQGNDDVLFEVARLAMLIHNIPLAIKCLVRSNALLYSYQYNNSSLQIESESLALMTKKYTYAHALYLLSLCYVHVKDFDKAQHALKDCLKHEKDFVDAQRMLHLISSKHKM